MPVHCLSARSDRQTVLSRKCDILSLLKEDQIARDNRLRGRIWARPPPRGLPRKTAQRNLDDVVGAFPFFLACSVASALLCALSVSCIIRWYVPGKGRLRVGPTTRRVEDSFLFFVLLLLSWGRFPRRGRLRSPRCLGPSRLTPEGCGAAHGPRHPAYFSSWFEMSWFVFLASVLFGMFGFAFGWQLRSKKSLLAMFSPFKSWSQHDVRLCSISVSLGVPGG